ncbi:MAG: DUF2384 domain-containing protein [Rhodocyclaceae bacterium]|nr:DUF2384 domain-containing protein [Rhodocyclaceae bacterium]
MQTVALLQDKSKAKRPPPLDAGALAGAGLRGFFGIAEKWGLAERDCIVLLGEPSRATYYNWKKGDVGKVGRDTIDRLSYIVGIYKALQILIPDESIADGWIRNPNDAPLFAGQAPLALMLSGQLVDLFRVRAFLDAQRGGWG